MKNSNKFWIAVISKDHTMRAVEGGFIQLSHGKEAPLKRLHAGDWMLIYSSKLIMNGNEKCQSFTAIGRVRDEEIFIAEMNENFKPFRRKVQFFDCEFISIIPLIEKLSFIKNKKSWGFPFRFGFFEVNKEDFLLIAQDMVTESIFQKIGVE
ncbi:MAG: EVE domain-containing protein [Chitinophagaceae bacterium]